MEDALWTQHVRWSVAPFNARAKKATPAMVTLAVSKESNFAL
jgi:hypothetical protein